MGTWQRKRGCAPTCRTERARREIATGGDAPGVPLDAPFHNPERRTPAPTRSAPVKLAVEVCKLVLRQVQVVEHAAAPQQAGDGRHGVLLHVAWGGGIGGMMAADDGSCRGL